MITEQRKTDIERVLYPSRDKEDDALEHIQPTWPVACLDVYLRITSLDVRPLLEVYGLRSYQSTPMGPVHLFCAVRGECQHKRQTVRLFVAGVDILLRSRSAGLFLHEIDRLRLSLAARMHAGLGPVPSHKQATSLPPPYGSFILASPAQLYLTQAGFLLPNRPAGFGSPLALDIGEIRRIYRDLLQPAEDGDRNASPLQAMTGGLP